VVNVLFPETVRAGLPGHGTERPALRPLAYGIAVAAAFGLATVFALALLAQPALTIFAGPAYAPAAVLLRIIAFAMAVLTLVQIVVTFMQPAINCWCCRQSRSLSVLSRPYR
jgi:O-antigen/teichoic acid export membrane protein